MNLFSLLAVGHEEFYKEEIMLSHNTAVATIAVKDMDKARRFYEETLGLEPVQIMGDEVATYKSGDSEVFVYKSKFAGGYNATVATWVIDSDIEEIVKELKDRGVSFEHYKDMPDTEIKGDIHISGNMKVAWFKDPDGNVICLVNETRH